jgi:hypothetical protein
MQSPSVGRPAGCSVALTLLLMGVCALGLVVAVLLSLAGV